MLSIAAFIHVTPQILVRGVNSHLIIGKERSPFTHTEPRTITLTGVRNDNPLSLGNQVILGSKAIGIFGNVSNPCYTLIIFIVVCSSVVITT